MAKVTEADVSKFFKIIGVNDSGSRGRSANLYRVLGVLPETDEDGNRIKTPYEHLGVPPQFRNGKEVPIVFAIKNRVAKVGRFTGSDLLFYYSKRNKIRQTQSQTNTIEELKKKYRHAQFIGNIDEAMKIVDIINSVSGGKADEIMGSFYNYAMFYKRMKKQLLVDMFNHFFLTYLTRFKSQVKEGLINDTKQFRPYFERQSFTVSGNDLNEISKEQNFATQKEYDFGDIKSIKIDNNFFDDGLDFSFGDLSFNDESKTEENPAVDVGVEEKPEKVEIKNKKENQEPDEFNFIGKIEDEPVSKEGMQEYLEAIREYERGLQENMQEDGKDKKAETKLDKTRELEQDSDSLNLR